MDSAEYLIKGSRPGDVLVDRANERWIVIDGQSCPDIGISLLRVKHGTIHHWAEFYGRDDLRLDD
jgi:hypothetical protein